ncbi:hypothetical protein [Streptomyces millisiae]|uniref:Uncharacterized protein n=1 Tax=Streptomyces millisiae TaxID=3075542 RepID=A0ABU2LYF6_9ACTN|nr:hypothetical protein [Streptomyces sp. DSM 44918]MDT0322308.1 hypothetical protein [Streptomyces sp. DSM 44918]
MKKFVLSVLAAFVIAAVSGGVATAQDTSAGQNDTLGSVWG